jgi:type II secretory pathway component PulJ
MSQMSCSAHVTRCPISSLSHDGVGEGFKPERVRRQSRNTGCETLKKKRRAREGVHSSGYLLLEVLLALAILSIVVVMIFQIIQTTLKVTSDINFLQTQQRKVDGITELLRRNFDSMPRTCMFQTRNINGSLELIFRNAPFSFSWVNTGAIFGTVVVASRPQPDGRLALSVLQESGNALDSYVEAGNKKKAEWFPLMNDVEHLSWRFFDEGSGKWSPDWPNSATKPNLVELTFKLGGRNHTERCVFRWPIAQTRY